ncbi:hypothetical protein KIN20_033975 [Parelaphostrongylus tenuis]|uniref:C2H2-type domain-containing protein n=1 Tax=Parelaphostrongylus tenuis TaxID=148309 RepID=A0AAD5R9G1_PARTN|nr:hypothetical protein KIN20_033975 [Parelaphostrongylus tenuis]
MNGILRLRQLAILAVIAVSFIFVYNGYSARQLNREFQNQRYTMPGTEHFREEEFDFEIIVSGQDSDRRYESGAAKSVSSSVSATTLHSQKCEIPKLDINGTEVKDFFHKAQPLECRKKHPENWVYIDQGGKIQYIESRKNAKCNGSFVTRRTDETNDYRPFSALPSGQPLLSDFAIVRCQDGDLKWSGILMSVVRLSDKELLRKSVSPSSESSGLNVYFLGFDSLSQMTFRRKMPKTVRVLEETFHSVVLNGYNIVGDGTPQAFIPILTASTEEELPLTRKRFREANYVDDVYPFIWNNFSSSGYVTLYGEDAFAIGTFTYRLKGFRKKPTDHYLRTIFKEYEQKFGGNCLGSEPLHKTWFRYSREFMRVYSDMPRFLLMHQSLLSHDDINLVEVEDDDLANHLLSMHRNGELKNTMVIVMADHGHRFAKIRATHQGQLEERLPFFSIALPEKFRETENGRKMYENLLRNKDRLTTPFDIHATLMDILHMPSDLTTEQDAKQRSLSVFRPIPENRTCAQAGVEPHWCTCLNWQNALNTPDERAMAEKLARAVVVVINRQLKNVFHLCAKLTFEGLLDAKKLVPNDSLLKYKDVKDRDGFVPDLSGDTKAAFAHYQLTFRTKPGDAIYEVTLFYDHVASELHVDLTSISHPNKFGNAPHCIINQNYFLATFCYELVSTYVVISMLVEFSLVDIGHLFIFIVVMSCIINVYPTVNDIVTNENDLKCQCCGKSFSNASARRMHTVKTHGILNCDGDKRIFERISDGMTPTYIYHCPAEGCRRKELKFEGMRNLKQHYMRVHTEKSISCDCGASFALRKDLLYHAKKRCVLRDLQKQSAKPEIRNDAASPSCEPPPRKQKYVKRVQRILKEVANKNSISTSTATVATSAEASTSASRPLVQPVIIVVPTENVAATVDAIKEIFRTMNETAAVVQPFEFSSTTGKAALFETLMRREQSSCEDFTPSPSFNPASFFFPSGNTTANASSSTDQSNLDFAQSTTFCYGEQRPVEGGIQYSYDGELLPQVRNRTTSTSDQYLDQMYSGETAVAGVGGRVVRTFGTMVDETFFPSVACVRNAETSMDAPEFDLLRDTETQTPWSDSMMANVWTDMGQSP